MLYAGYKKMEPVVKVVAMLDMAAAVVLCVTLVVYPHNLHLKAAAGLAVQSSLALRAIGLSYDPPRSHQA